MDSLVLLGLRIALLVVLWFFVLMALRATDMSFPLPAIPGPEYPPHGSRLRQAWHGVRRKRAKDHGLPAR